jgi:hypothetical protein
MSSQKSPWSPTNTKTLRGIVIVVLRGQALLVGSEKLELSKRCIPTF